MYSPLLVLYYVASIATAAQIQKLAVVILTRSSKTTTSSRLVCHRQLPVEHGRLPLSFSFRFVKNIQVSLKTLMVCNSSYTLKVKALVVILLLFILCM